MLHYILQTIVFQCIFLLFYDWYLKRETFFSWNRFYLLFTTFLSFFLPFLKVSALQKVAPQDFVIVLPDIILGASSPTVLTNTQSTTLLFAESFLYWSWTNMIYIGMFIAGLLFIQKCIHLWRLTHKNPRKEYENLYIITLLKENRTFSFFNYIYLGEKINEKEKKLILTHEMVHVKQRHTLDLLCFEILRILFWYNPLIYIYQNKISEVHEYIADAKAIKPQQKLHFYQNLLSQVFETKDISFVNPFFKNPLIKKRIAMLSKTKSHNINLFKYILIVPMVGIMLCYTSCEKGVINNNNMLEHLSDEELKNKLYNELIERSNNGENMFNDYNYYLPNNENYIQTREDYYKFKIFMQYIAEKSENKRSLDSIIVNRSYDDYLEWKKTDEAKAQWENITRDGVLKLVVQDLNKLTTNEKTEYDQYLKSVTEDNYFTKFVMTDGFKTVTVIKYDSEQNNSKMTSLSNSETEVPFVIIDKVPLFPGCEYLLTNTERKDCMSKKINEHINTHFDMDLARSLGLSGEQRINVIFKINTNGLVGNIRARAPHPKLEEEAIRVIKLLPGMMPGQQDEHEVVVPYSLPIKLNL